MKEALREIAGRLERSPTTIEYTRERELIKKESMDAGRRRVLPSYQAIHRRFGAWENALAEAGLELVQHDTEEYPLWVYC
jgi:Homing endonuclease associated repeat